jgi:prevent-host-death family protein
MTTLTNSTIGLAEAKNKLSELIERVARGEEITITRHAEAIARLVPAKCPSREEARKAVEAIRALRAKNPASLTVKQILALKNEGRP